MRGFGSVGAKGKVGKGKVDRIWWFFASVSSNLGNLDRFLTQTITFVSSSISRRRIPYGYIDRRSFECGWLRWWWELQPWIGKRPKGQFWILTFVHYLDCTVLMVQCLITSVFGRMQHIDAPSTHHTRELLGGVCEGWSDVAEKILMIYLQAFASRLCDPAHPDWRFAVKLEEWWKGWGWEWSKDVEGDWRVLVGVGLSLCWSSVALKMKEIEVWGWW